MVKGSIKQLIRLGLILFILFSLFQVLPDDLGYVDRAMSGSARNQTIDDDFRNGSFNNVNLSSSGEIFIEDQVNFIEDTSINIMDLESYESFDVDWPKDEDMKKKITDLKKNPSVMAQTQVEYWSLAGKTLINRIFASK